MKKEIIERIERFLKSIEGIDFGYVAFSETLAGRSAYFLVAKKGQLDLTYGDGIKVRFSDHSVTNTGRVLGEIHFNIDGSNWDESPIKYALGFEGYDFLPTRWVEEVIEIPAEHMQEDYEIISTRTTKKGNVRHTIRRMVGTHFEVVKTK